MWRRLYDWTIHSLRASQVEPSFSNGLVLQWRDSSQTPHRLRLTAALHSIGLLSHSIDDRNDAVLLPLDDDDHQVAATDRQRACLRALQGSLDVQEALAAATQSKELRGLRCLHESEERGLVFRDWVAAPGEAAATQRLARYFGSEVGFYFAWLSFYTDWLGFPAKAGFMTLMVPPEWRGVASVALSVALAVWSSCLLKAWRRKQSELRFRWRVAIVEELELHRIEFKGAWRFSPLTGKMEPFFSSQERLVRYLITWPLFGAAISVLILFQVLVFRMEEMFAVRFTGMIVFLPTALYTASLPLISQGYTKIALKLTKFENHRTQGAHDRAFSAKQVIFQCAVYYLSLFYILLWKRDLKRLQEQLAIIFIIRQVVSNMAELGIPLVFALVNTYKVSKKKNHLKAYEYEAGLAVYPGTFDDHLEILIQFGYIFLFGWSWPLAAFFAYLNNVVELRTDLLKLCTGMQKPLPKEYNGIEIWLTMFEILSLGGVITNTIYLIIICYTDEIDFLPGISLPDKICIVLFIEHIILFVRMAIGHLFDDESSDTRELQAKEKLQTGWPKSEASHEITSKKND